MKKETRIYVFRTGSVFYKDLWTGRKMEAIAIRDFLEDYLDESLYQEITSVSLKNGMLDIKLTHLS